MKTPIGNKTIGVNIKNIESLIKYDALLLIKVLTMIITSQTVLYLDQLQH